MNFGDKMYCDAVSAGSKRKGAKSPMRKYGRYTQNPVHIPRKFYSAGA